MFDLVCIFTTGGVILFYKAFCVLKFDILDYLIKKILLQEKTSETSYSLEPYTVKWRLVNEFNLIISAVYQELFHLTYVEDLLDLIKENYVKTVLPSAVVQQNLYKNIPAFDGVFEECLRKWEDRKRKEDKKASIMRSFDENKKKSSKKPAENSSKSNEIPKEKEKPSKKPANSQETTAVQPKVEEISEEVLRNRQKLALRFEKKSNSSKVVEKEPIEVANPSKKPKEKTFWTTPKETVTAKDMKMLDNSKLQSSESQDQAFRDKYLGGEEEKLEGFYDSGQDDASSEEEPEEIEEIPKKTAKTRGFFARISDGLKNITGNKVITDEDIESLLAKCKEDLMNKNVAEEISQRLCESIKKSLVDKRTQAFTSLRKTVKLALEDALTKILTPKRNINIISEAMKARESGKPYVLVFIGVNGVGKSTNLAKVAYLFKNQGFSVMLAACDNFRSGAVEQIKTHGRCLDVPVFDRGYKEDPAIIAQKAIKEVSLAKFPLCLS